MSELLLGNLVTYSIANMLYTTTYLDLDDFQIGVGDDGLSYVTMNTDREELTISVDTEEAKLILSGSLRETITWTVDPDGYLEAASDLLDLVWDRSRRCEVDPEMDLR